MQRIGALLALLFLASCVGDEPTAPAPNAHHVPATAALSGPKGYGFRVDPGGSAVSTILNGTNEAACSGSDAGSVTYTLALNTRILNEITGVINEGGTAVVEVVTQSTFTGDGTYTYTEDIQIDAGGVTFGSNQSQETSVDPGVPSIIRPRTFSQAITVGAAGNWPTGTVVRVVATGTGFGTLTASQCGELTGGEVKWRPYGAVLRLTP
jgi:hypothetical protein